jgi:23S rRNA (uracil1939-C5)-methyltransferase
MAGRVARLTGVEIVPEAVECAVANAARAGIENARFLCADSALGASELLDVAGELPDVVVLDPPRKGCAAELLDTLHSAGVGKIVYISCNPATLARDLAHLHKLGWSIGSVLPVDLFPRTGHVESVVLLSQLKSTDHIKVEIELSEEDLTPSEAKGTYNEIKEYIYEKYQVKVSSLYISQVKRKLGLHVGESYNKPKNDSAHVPTCPEKKEKIIVEALKHFKMI